jgi:hypothetical protein
MARWQEYLREFRALYAALSPDLLEPGAVECNGGPDLRCTDPRFPNKAPWRMDWAVIYGDGKYFRVKESFKPVGCASSRVGEREHFSFHYGTAHLELDQRGYPHTMPTMNPPVADLRVDLDKNLVPHIHVGSRVHLLQNSVQGYDIGNASVRDFLEAVRQHRKNPAELLTKLLNITVVR